MPLVLFPQAAARSFTTTLPANTIFFEDFSDTAPSWHQNDDCTLGQVSRNTTIVFPGDTASLWINCRTSGEIEDAHFSFAYPPNSDFAGTSFWVTGGTQIMNDTASSGVVGLSIEYWDQDEHLEAKLDYSPRLCNWDWFYGAAGASATILKMCVPTETQTAGPVTPHIAQSWVPIKLVMQRSTDKWVSIAIADKTFTAADLEAKVAGGSAIRSISAVGAGWTADVFGSAEFSVSSGSTTINNSFHFAHLLVTNETPGAAGIVTLSLWNAAYIIAATIGFLTVAVLGKVVTIEDQAKRTEWLQKSWKIVLIMATMATIIFLVGMMLQG